MKPTTNLKIIINKIAKFVPVLTVLLVPIFFLPITTEFFSFNKLALIVCVTLFLIVMWGLKIVAGDKIEIAKSPIDRSLIVLSLVVILATIFSVSKADSIYGSPGRWLGLFGFMVFVAFFYIATPLLKGIKTIKNSLFALLIGSTISSIVAILSYYNITLGKADFLRAYFTLTGSINDAILLGALSVVLAFSFILNEKDLGKRLMLINIAIVNFFLVAITGKLVGWAVVLVGLMISTFYNKAKVLERKTELGILSIIMTLVLALVLVPTTRGFVVNPNFRSDLVLSLRETWAVSTSTIRDFPLLATGPGTFYVNFSRYRPLSLNASPFWNVQFNLPFNGVFEVLTTLGIIGLAVAIFFGWKMVSFAHSTSKLQDESGVSKIATTLLLTVLTASLFTFPTVLNIFLVFFSLALVVASHLSVNNQLRYVEIVAVALQGGLTYLGAEETNVVNSDYFKYVLSLPLFAIAGYLGFLTYKNYVAEYYMRKSIIATIANDGGGAYNFQSLAINNNPKRDYYYTSYARTNLALANTLASKQDLTDAEKQTIQTLLSQAIRNARIASETLNPLNARNWETRAVIYRAMLNVAQNAGEWAINSYNTAIQLDPTNPRLRVDLGGIFYAQGDFLSAANQFRQAINLKQDYANAHYNFAMALINLQDLENARRELEITRLLVPEGSPDYEIVVAQLASLESIPGAAGAQEEKPTVEELAGVDQEEETPPQEPLENIGEETPPEKNIDTEVLPEQEEKQAPEKPEAE